MQIYVSDNFLYKKIKLSKFLPKPATKDILLFKILEYYTTNKAFK